MSAPVHFDSLRREFERTHPDWTLYVLACGHMESRQLAPPQIVAEVRALAAKGHAAGLATVYDAQRAWESARLAQAPHPTTVCEVCMHEANRARNADLAEALRPT